MGRITIVLHYWRLYLLYFLFNLLILYGCEGDNTSNTVSSSPIPVHIVEVKQLPSEITFTSINELEENQLKPAQSRIDNGVDYQVFSCTASQVDSKWRTCCDVRITNNTGANITGVILIGWQAGSGSPEVARTGWNNTGYDGSGTGWRTTDGVTPNPSANGGWALWFKFNGAGIIPSGGISDPRRICLQSITGYSTSLWYLYEGCPSGRVVNGNNYVPLMGWAMLGDEVNDPNYPELGSGNYVVTDQDGYYAFPELSATNFIHNAGSNCFNDLRQTTGSSFINMPLTPACMETFVPNDDVTDSILVFDHTQNGSVAPVRRITGSATFLNGPHRVAVDTVNNEIVVGNVGNNSISIYPRLADGNVAPLRVIQGASTLIDSPEDVAVDAENNEIFVTNKGSNAILVFSRTANGNVSPLRSISGALTKLNRPRGIAVDYINNEIFVANDGTNSILVFPRNGNGNIAPLREIAGNATGISKPRRIAVDPLNDEVIVPEQSIEAVLVFSRTANGNVSPLRVISGGLTTILNPEGVAVDTINNEIIVGNKSGTPSLLVFSRTADGNVSPLRSISGGNTFITNPFGPGVSY